MRGTTRGRLFGAYVSAGGAGIGLVVAQIARNTAVLDRVWAEDGAVFGRQAFDGHVWEQVGRGYAGYLVAPQRLLAAPIVSVVPPARWGMWFALAAMAVAAASALAVYRLSGGILVHRPTRAALAALVAVGPKMRGEWPAISNVAWPLLAAMFWVIVSVRIDWFSTFLRCVVAASAITASGLGLAFVPLAVVVLLSGDWKFFRRVLDRGSLVSSEPGSSDDARTRLRTADRWVAGTIGVAACLQIVGLATAVAGAKPFRSNNVDIAKLLVVRVFGSVVTGERFIDEAWRSWGLAFGVICAIAIVGGLALGFRRTCVSICSLATLAIAYAIGIGAVSLRTRGTEPFALQAGRFSFDAERYFIVPTFLVVSAIAMGVDRGRLRRRNGEGNGDGEGAPQYRRSLVASGVFAGFVVIMLIGTAFTQRNEEQPSDPWSVALRQARSSCRADPSPDRVDIPIAPAGIFRLNVPCSRLR